MAMLTAEQIAGMTGPQRVEYSRGLVERCHCEWTSRRNTYAARCAGCDQHVAESEGRLIRLSNTQWAVLHRSTACTQTFAAAARRAARGSQWDNEMDEMEGGR